MHCGEGSVGGSDPQELPLCLVPWTAVFQGTSQCCISICQDSPDFAGAAVLAADRLMRDGQLRRYTE